MKPLTAMNFYVDNVAEEWKKWEKQWKVFYTKAELGVKRAATHVGILLNNAGLQALDIHSTFEFAPASNGNAAEDPTSGNTDTVLKTLKEYCEPCKNIVFEHYKFWNRTQAEGETVDQWVTELKNRPLTCEFGDQKDLLVSDKMVFGVRNDRVKEQLLREVDLSLEKA